MNQVSKLLIVLQMFLSLMFMAFAAAVYSTEMNWKKAADEAQASVAQTQALLTSEQEKNDQLKQDHTTVVAELRLQAETNLAQANDFKRRLDEVLGTEGDPGQLAKVRTERDVAQAEARVASEEAAARVAEATALRDEVRKLRSQVDTLVTEARTRDDKVLELTRQMTAAIRKDKVDQSTIARLTNLLIANGLDPKARVDASGRMIAEGREPLEHVTGKVLSARRNSSGSTEFVQVSLGQDDGVEVGNRLHIYRGRKFIADVILREVGADEAVGIVDENLRNGMIQRGDNVTSKL